MRTSHVDFGGRATWNFNSADSNNADCNGHGTHVAGTIGGAAYGVAKGVRLHAVKVLDCAGRGSTAGVIAGVNWVTANKISPAVANMSLGGGADSALDAAVLNSINAGVTYVVAAGNDNADACNYSPARVSRAITVGATTSTDTRAYFSNYGRCVDVFAPGQSITSAWNSGDTASNTIDGTSMAAPHVAGAAALLLGSNPTMFPGYVDIELTVINATTGRLSGINNGSPNKLLHTLITPPRPGTDVVPVNQTLATGQYIRSDEGNYELVMQADGNLVLYQDGFPLWNTPNTWGNWNAYAVVQGDGNFVVYAPGGRPLWSSNTWSKPIDRLELQSDGNLALWGRDGRMYWDILGRA
ncbi:S8 family serine peptidase [Micromonospora sp. NPDC006766]|uniref:S8 family serine peptidase n=1 Tax=Micromonospora sp. NPDC006766 TaxID=3154778 RepID=UPI00340DFFAD